MLRKMLKGIREIIYPATCLSCKNSLKNKNHIKEIICLDCWEKIPRNIPPFCQRCGRHLDKRALNKNICPACQKVQFHFDRAFSPCVYDGVLKELIWNFKYKDKDFLGEILSKPMIEFIKEYDLPMNFIDLIIPVPLHKVRLREREFNQAEVLSEHIAREFKKELSVDALIRLRHTKTQTDLDQQKRLLNVRDSFAVADTKKIKNRNILLVDDVFTSGATASEGARALKNAGAGVVFVMTLAN